MDILHTLLYALLSGLTVYLPVSSEPHQMLYRLMTGFTHEDPFLPLFLHAGALAALLFHCNGRIRRLNYERRLAGHSRRRRNRQPDPVILLDLRVLRTAMIPVLLSLPLVWFARKWISGILLMTLMLVFNTLVLFLPRLLPEGNKDGRGISWLDSFLIGLGGALGAIPGVSWVGGMISAGLSRGVDRRYMMDMALLLSIPAMVGIVVMDILSAVVQGAVVSSLLLNFGAGIVSYGGAMAAIAFLRYLSSKADLSAFRYYSLGLAVFSFVFYLVI